TRTWVIGSSRPTQSAAASASLRRFAHFRWCVNHDGQCTKVLREIYSQTPVRSFGIAGQAQMCDPDVALGDGRGNVADLPILVVIDQGMFGRYVILDVEAHQNGGALQWKAMVLGDARSAGGNCDLPHNHSAMN